ncbi:esterase-like activity of phytase family protein [Sediminicoccus sp. KRV36]|uniref:esterase-like activity of phytase family protein n=1 Tax=Sediminicoccus sp. KRV36 TaxID=3133721 RepID=UPI00200F3045|nr:esterase-like activity of phytase family protein [Sediminicoccus rosea]UPY37053.1 esterase-like activity of phytase family protein [Sediminicoccus rosea]
MAGLSLLPACAADAGASTAAPLPLGLPARPFLTPLGALRLNTPAWGFGGFSGLHLAPDLTLTAISDLGRWWRAPLLLREGRLIGLGDVRHGPLRDAAGAVLRRGGQGDAESLVRLANGEWLVGFERRHRILRYRDLGGPGQPVELPPGLAEAPHNGGLEGLGLLRDGRLLALAEQLPGEAGPESRAAWLGTRQGPGIAWQPASYMPAPGLEPTDLAGLPDGGALVLERRFSLFGGFTARLAHLPAAMLRGPGPFLAETWLDLPPDAPAENWEGVAVARHGGRLLVALISDDNQSLLQETLLLLYAMA